MQYFVVFQNQSYQQEKTKGILWAPKLTSNGGKPLFHWTNMTKCEIGDVVFSIVQNKIVSRGIVKKPAVTADNPLNNSLWVNEGWLVELEYNFTINNIKITDHITKIRNFLPDKYAPFNPKTGNGNQGYLYTISHQLGYLLDDLIVDVVHDIDVRSVFDLDAETAELIHGIYDEADIQAGEVKLVEEDPPDTSNKPKTKITKVYGRKVDYLNKAKRDQKQGIIAERLVYEYEKKYLKDHQKNILAEKVKWVSKDADGYGYDILSYDLNGNEKYIEVKSTSLGKNTPFDISANEVETSKKYQDKYWVYRVYHMDDDQPRFYVYQGAIEQNFSIETTSYKAYLK